MASRCLTTKLQKMENQLDSESSETKKKHKVVHFRSPLTHCNASDEPHAKARHSFNTQECIMRSEHFLGNYTAKNERITHAIAEIERATFEICNKMKPVIQGLIDYQGKINNIAKQNDSFVETLEEFIAVQEKRYGKEDVGDLIDAINHIKGEIEETVKLLNN